MCNQSTTFKITQDCLINSLCIDINTRKALNKVSVRFNFESNTQFNKKVYMSKSSGQIHDSFLSTATLCSLEIQNISLNPAFMWVDLYASI